MRCAACGEGREGIELVSSRRDPNVFWCRDEVGCNARIGKGMTYFTFRGGEYLGLLPRGRS